MSSPIASTMDIDREDLKVFLRIVEEHVKGYHNAEDLSAFLRVERAFRSVFENAG